MLCSSVGCLEASDVSRGRKLGCTCGTRGTSRRVINSQSYSDDALEPFGNRLIPGKSFTCGPYILDISPLGFIPSS